MSILMMPPFMHGAAQWAAYNIITMGGRIVIPDDVERLRADDVLRLVERERVLSIPVVGDAMARPLIDEIESGDYDLSSLISVTNGGAPMSPGGPRPDPRGAAQHPADRRRRLVGGRPADDHPGDRRRGRRRRCSTRSPTPRSSPTDYSRVLEPGDGERLAGPSRT